MSSEAAVLDATASADALHFYLWMTNKPVLLYSHENAISRFDRAAMVVRLRRQNPEHQSLCVPNRLLER